MPSSISKRVVDACQPADKDVFLWDSRVKGFGLKVTPTGRKVYLLQYRTMNGRLRRFTIGRHGAPWTPDRARVEAVRLLGEIADGADPSMEKRLARAAPSLSDVIDAYFHDGCHSKKASTIAMERRLAVRHIKPLIGDRRAADLNSHDIEAFMKDVAEGRTRVD
ncbi:MAG: Arm DNA-binding domain-containing protein [Pseudomonadota bacterium]